MPQDRIFHITGMDRSQFEKVFDSYYEPLVNYIYYKCGDMETAQDIIQDAFLKVWEMRDRIRLESVKSLLYTIAGNLYNNQHHHRKVVLKFVHAYDGNNGPESPQDELEYKEFGQKVQEALSQLSVKNREVFLMNRIDQLTYSEIAGRLGISVKAVEKRMNRALVFLRKAVDTRI
jgi:RNA polymerase sigma-70 factor (family 1)